MNRNFILGLLVAAALSSCSTARKAVDTSTTASLKATIDIAQVQNDKVRVTVIPPALPSGTATYQFAKIIPGTYAIADYGRYIEDLKALDASGNAIAVSMKDSNTWVISDGGKLASLSYLVNDTYDVESGDAFEENSSTIFSPAGTNILAGKNFMLNLCGFVGYFTGKKDIPYTIEVLHPETLQGASSMTDGDASAARDRFTVDRYAEMVDHPVMYSVPDVSTARVGDMDLLLSIYSPRKKSINSAAFFPDIQKMISAQKHYLGTINHTQKYAVLTYITTYANDDAKGIGALEHNTSTTAVFQEGMKSKDLIDVISHEFFHTLTPLNVHSKEIQDFDFNEPKMSAHLWMYEGITEYFANHFQVHEGLIDENAFYDRMAEKVKFSTQMYKDDQSFTEMSKNVLDGKMKEQYPNVYQKGALMAMCLDIILREQSGGKTGVLYLMGELSKKYGPTRPFDDADLIPEITKMTSPEVGEFLQDHVVKGIPVDYNKYLARVGVTPATIKEPTPVVFLAKGRPYVSVDTSMKKAVFVVPDTNNAFINALGIQHMDELLEWNGSPIDASDVMKVLLLGYKMDEDEPVTIKVSRKGQAMELAGKAKLNYMDGQGFRFTDLSRQALKDAWLKN
jgi:predicted metalloprotease with PDZ domain